MSVLLIAVVSGLLYFLGTSRIGYGLSSAIGAPVTLGFVFGLMFGDPIKGLILGASINLLYLGVVFTGGNVPSDGCLAACIAIPVAFQLNLDVDTAVTIAVPFGILGSFIDQIRRTSNLIWLHKADDCAAKGDQKGIYWCAMIYPTIVAFAIRFIPVFVINMFGANVVQTILTYLPQFIITGLSVAGGILPAIGFAVIIMSIGRKELLPYFFMGFFAVKYLNVGTMACAVFGICIAALMYFKSNKKGEVA
ncbi:PTS mannose/fructose/sorbose/N-acetylgalactosamine transporter subunit IIC [Anaerorhabdus furcosa]|uniref:PTS system, D-glucosaminate-specific IIC component n=1 Tax=Anaerorhabdus furcosa TaxID=118967 RepID=A0A1T4MMK7_9FIRM|nr:PTS sugar transporter subunit IIC [Anaerorhabdus furcosa]SJZ68309.1 PTS system, D-glucosaminate-specific IIC component [Anaerorhabdus furcosa]